MKDRKFNFLSFFIIANRFVPIKIVEDFKYEQSYNPKFAVKYFGVDQFEKQYVEGFSPDLELITNVTFEKLNIENVEIAKYYKMEYNDVTHFFIGHEFFNRKYFFNHDDDFLRFTFLNKAILELMSLIDFFPEIMHLNDWSTSLIPYIISSEYSEDSRYTNIKTLLTIHNLEKQGAFARDYEKYFTKKNFTYLHLNDINFLKTGIMRATRINTVSKSYRSEMLTKFFGFTLDGALKSRQYQLKGIQNGIDYNLYNPETDKNIYFNYNINNFEEGKKINKSSLLKDYNLKDQSKPIVSFISRFAKEKGISLIIDTIEEFLIKDLIYFFVIGEGDIEYEKYFNNLAKKYPDNVVYVLGHNQKISQKFYAGSDLLLMPSLYEASGLNQMIAMRYGCLPIVRETGGLKDTVTPFDKNNANGFSFKNFDDKELNEAIYEAITLFNKDKSKWNKLIYNAMSIDNSIERMALEYDKLYEEIINAEY